MDKELFEFVRNTLAVVGLLASAYAAGYGVGKLQDYLMKKG